MWWWANFNQTWPESFSGCLRFKIIVNEKDDVPQHAFDYCSASSMGRVKTKTYLFYKTDICCFSAKHAALKSKSKDWWTTSLS
jgi:hypothetical protein